ncbi:MAG: four helix bundle protein [Candidatus Vogelbacteria bacterium]
MACYLTLHQQAIKFPKPDRFTLGTRLENLMLDLIELVLLTKSKTGLSQMLLLNKTDIKLQTIKLMVRLSYEAKSLPTSAYAKIEEQLLELGRLIGGWLKQTKTEKP